MPVEKAVKAFKEEKMSCGQSILKGFQDIKGVSDHDIVEAKKFGGGRAEQGRCGALHAILMLTPCPEKRARLIEDFIETAKSPHCREIRKTGTLSCAQCVELAATLLCGSEMQ